MIFIYVIVLLLVGLFVWDTVEGFPIVFTAHASATEMVAHMGLQSPILTFEIQKNVSSPMITVRLFDIRFMRKRIAAKRRPGGLKKGIRLARSAAISRLSLSADYSLGDPFYTAMVLAVTGATAKFLTFEQLEVQPDYLSVEPYLSVKGNATVKFGKTILKYIQNK